MTTLNKEQINYFVCFDSFDISYVLWKLLAIAVRTGRLLLFFFLQFLFLWGIMNPVKFNCDFSPDKLE